MTLSFFKKFFGGSAAVSVGIDIGTTSIKVVELERNNNHTRLVNYGVLAFHDYDRPTGAFEASPLKLFEADVADYLQLLLRKTGVRTRNAVASLPSFAVFSTLLDLPPMPEQEIANAVQFKARQYIPLPISSVSLDWVRVENQKILLLAIPNELIQKYNALCTVAGLHLIALEVEGVSFARVFSQPGGAASTQPVFIIDIGSRSTGFFIVENGILKFMGQSDFSGASLTHGIASGLGISLRRAEDVKREQGIMRGGGAPDELSTLLIVTLDGILMEAQRFRERFVVAYGKDIQAVVLAGGGAHLPGLVDYVAQKLGVPVTKAHPFMHCAYPPAAEAAFIPLGPELAVAAGAAMRGIAP